VKREKSNVKSEKNKYLLTPDFNRVKMRIFSIPNRFTCGALAPTVFKK